MSNPYKIKTHKRIYRKSWSSILVRSFLILISGSVLFGLGWFLYEPASSLFEGAPSSQTADLQPVADLPAEDAAPNQKDEEEQPQQPTAPKKEEETPAEEESEEPQMSSEEALQILSVVPPITLGSGSSGSASSNTPQRIAYFSQNSVLDAASFAKQLQNAKNAGMQAALVELKAPSGLVSYPIQYIEGKDSNYTVPNPVDLKKIVAQIEEAGLIPMAAIHAFQDSKFQLAEWDAAVHYENTKMLWLDNARDAGGKSWLNPYAPQAKEYIAKIVEDAAAAGFQEVVLQSFQFPVGFATEKMGFGQTNGQSKQDCLKSLSEFYRQQAERLKISLRIEYPASAMTGGNTAAYGGDGTALVNGPTAVDCSLLQFNEKFETDQLKLENPQNDPKASYHTIAQAVANKGENLIARISSVGLSSEQQNEITEDFLQLGYRGVIIPYA